MDYLIIQLAEYNVTVARFELSGRAASLAGSALFELNPEQDLAAVAAQIAAGISGSPRVVLCLPPDLFAQRSVELPLKDLRKVREVLSAHLQGEIALPVEEAVFDALPSADGRFMAIWARRSEISASIDLFREAGLEPAVVSSAPFAWPFLPGIPGECVLSDGSAAAVVSGGRLSFVRALSGPEREKQLAATLAALQMSDLPLPPRLIVFGEMAAVQAGDAFALPTETLPLPEELARLFRTEQVFQQLAALYAVALACQAGELPDFRRGDLAWTAGDVQLRKKLRLTAVLAVVALLLLFVAKGMKYRSARIDIASLNSSISAIYREIFPGRPKAVDEVAEIKGEIRKLAGAESSSGVLDVLKQLAEAKGATINGLYEAEVEGRTVRVKGDARSAQAVNEFKAALAPLMASVDLGEVKSRPDGSVSFTLNATLREGKK